MGEYKTAQGYINSASAQLIQLIAFIKNKLAALSKNNASAPGSEILREIALHIEAAEKLVNNLSEAAKPWQERVIKRDGASASELLKDYLEIALRHSATYGSSLSLVVFRVSGLEKIAKPKRPGETSLGIMDLAELVRTGLRRRADFVMNDEKSIYVILPETDRTESRAVAERLLSILRDYLLSKEGGKPIRIDFSVANSPENGDSFESLLAALR